MIIESIKKGFSLSGKALKLIAIFFGFNLVWNLITIFMIPNPATITTPPNLAAGVPPVPAQAVLMGLAFILLNVFFQGGMLATVREMVKTATCNLSLFIQSGLKYFLRLLLLGIIITLVVAIFFLLAVLFPAMAGGTQNGALIALAALLGLTIGIAGIVAIIFIVFSPYSIIIEDTGVIGALKRSISLVKSNFWPVVGVGFLLTLIIFGISFLVGLLTGIIVLGMPGTSGLIINALLGSLLNAYVAIFMTGTLMTVFYRLTQGAGPVSPAEPGTTA